MEREPIRFFFSFFLLISVLLINFKSHNFSKSKIGLNLYFSKPHFKIYFTKEIPFSKTKNTVNFHVSTGDKCEDDSGIDWINSAVSTKAYQTWRTKRGVEIYLFITKIIIICGIKHEGFNWGILIVEWKRGLGMEWTDECACLITYD